MVQDGVEYIAHRKSLTFAGRHCENDVSSVFLYIKNFEGSPRRSFFHSIFWGRRHLYIRMNVDIKADEKGELYAGQTMDISAVAGEQVILFTKD